MAVASDSDLWIGAKVDQSLFNQINRLAVRLKMTRSDVVRTVLRQTDVERVLSDLRREADAPAA